MRTSFFPADDVDDDDRTASDRPSPILVSLHFMRTALRRRFWLCVLSAILGLLAAAGFMLAFPTHEAKTALILTHSPDVISTDAMTTDISLLKTRTVAAKTVAQLGLVMTPEDFLGSLDFESSGSELMTLTLSAPTGAEAVRRLEAFTSVYLEFRAEQLSLQSRILVEGMQARIQKLQIDVENLSRRIEKLSAIDGAGGSKLTDTISQRAYIVSRVESLQQSVEDTTLQNSAIVASSRVLDPAAIEPGRAKRSIALGLATGLIGGTALGCGTVLFLAITSDRLRRRADVAEALGVTVSISVGRIAALPKGWRSMPLIRTLDRHRAQNRLKVAHAIGEELGHREHGRLAIACIDNADEVAFAVATTAETFAARGESITIIDLSEHPSRGLRLPPSSPSSSGSLAVLRPRTVPALAEDAADLQIDGQWDIGDNTPPPQLGDVTLVLADIEPAVGAYHLAAWADRVVVVATAGRSSVEKVRTVAELIVAAGLDLRFAVLLHTETSDHSSGNGAVVRPAPIPLRDQNGDGAGLRGTSSVR